MKREVTACGEGMIEGNHACHAAICNHATKGRDNLPWEPIISAGAGLSKVWWWRGRYGFCLRPGRCIVPAFMPEPVDTRSDAQLVDAVNRGGGGAVGVLL